MKLHEMHELDLCKDHPGYLRHHYETQEMVDDRVYQREEDLRMDNMDLVADWELQGVDGTAIPHNKEFQLVNGFVPLYFRTVEIKFNKNTITAN